MAHVGTIASLIQYTCSLINIMKVGLGLPSTDHYLSFSRKKKENWEVFFWMTKQHIHLFRHLFLL